MDNAETNVKCSEPMGDVGRNTMSSGSEYRDFGFALRNLRDGRKMFRDGWNGKGMWLQLQPPDFHSKMTKPYIFIHTADNGLVPWVASQSDMLANDWLTVRE